jgi:acyl-CoA hydrolase
MDLAAGIASKMATRGLSRAVANQSVDFISPVKVDATVSCYTKIVKTDKASVETNVEV